MAGIYEELKGWQSGIGSVLGFFALMAGALWNFHLNRRRDAALRREEMLSVATALYGEILLLREEIAQLARTVAYSEGRDGGIDEQFVEDHMPRDPILYPALASKLGLLPPDLIIDITRFHQNFQESKNNLRLLVEGTRKVSFSPLAVLGPAERAVEEIRPALRKIEQLAGIKDEAKDPDLGPASDIAEMERMKFEID